VTAGIFDRVLALTEWVSFRWVNVKITRQDLPDLLFEVLIMPVYILDDD
jgi:hypothetical protein